VLLDPDRRTEYDDILNSWDGPVSTDGTPILHINKWLERSLEGKTLEEVEESFQEYIQEVTDMSGYSPTRLGFLESMKEKVGGEVSDTFRSEYEDALLEKDRILALEEAQRSIVLGLPDIQDNNFIAKLGYDEVISDRLIGARETKAIERREIALGTIATRLALGSGETIPIPSPDALAQSDPTQSLPGYYDSVAARVQEIANERNEITNARLSNFEPNYIFPEQQTELQNKVIVGVEVKAGYRWLQAELDVENDSAVFEHVDDDISSLLGTAEYSEVIAHGYGLITLRRMEHIDLQDLLAVAVGKYSDKYKLNSENSISLDKTDS
jgi:hypothetical protein